MSAGEPTEGRGLRGDQRYRARVADRDPHVLAADARSGEALQLRTVIDADELATARQDDRWRGFCLNAERYVAETTRRPVSNRQTS